MDLKLVFDVSKSGYNDWSFLGISFPLLLLGLGLLIIGLYNRRKMIISIAVVMLLFIISGITLTLNKAIGDYHMYISALENNEFSITQGYVEDFIPMSSNGRQPESFIIDNVYFEYGGVFPSTIFNHSKVSGGPIDEGLYAKVHHYNGAILQLWVGDEKMVKFEENYFKLFHPEDVEVRMTTDGMDFVVYSFFINDNPFLKMYIGNHPSPDNEKTILEENSLVTRSILVRLHEIMSREEFIRRIEEADDLEAALDEIMSEEQGWPLWAHFWYTKLNQDTAALADNIITSITISDKQRADE